MNLIGLLGFAGSGKDTVGNMFIEAGYEKVSFAATLKDATACIFGWDRSLLEGDTKESREWRDVPDEYWTEKLGYTITPRYALQLMGTEACRNTLGEDIWVYSLLKSLDTTKKYIITDVRFPNEIKMIREVFGTIIRVRRGEEPEWYDTALIQNKELSRIDMMKKSYPNVHFSEWAWIGTEPDYLIKNDSTMEVLKHKVEMVRQFIEKPL